MAIVLPGIVQMHDIHIHSNKAPVLAYVMWNFYTVHGKITWDTRNLVPSHNHVESQGHFVLGCNIHYLESI